MRRGRQIRIAKLKEKLKCKAHTQIAHLPVFLRWVCFLPLLRETATIITTMKDVRKYIKILTEFSKKELKKHFQIEKLELDNFETRNR